MTEGCCDPASRLRRAQSRQKPHASCRVDPLPTRALRAWSPAAVKSRDPDDMGGGPPFLVLGLLTRRRSWPPCDWPGLGLQFPSHLLPSASLCPTHASLAPNSLLTQTCTSLLHACTCVRCREPCSSCSEPDSRACRTHQFLFRISQALLVVPCSWAREAGHRLAHGSQSLASPQPSPHCSPSLPDVLIPVTLPCLSSRAPHTPGDLTEPRGASHPSGSPHSALAGVSGSAMSQLSLQLPMHPHPAATCRAHPQPITCLFKLSPVLGQMTTFS